MQNSKTLLDIINRIKDIKHLRSDAQVAKVLQITRNDLYGFKRRGTVPHDALHIFCTNEGMRIDYILNGTLPVFESETSAIAESKAPYNANSIAPKISELLTKTAAVLESPTIFSSALKSNIEAFHTAVTCEQQLAVALKRIDDLEEHVKQIEKRLPAIVNGS